MSIIPTSFYRTSGKILGKLSETKWMNSRFEKKAQEPAKFAAAMLVTSIVSKDLVGCLFYTEQSWNNKKIPEEKRKFVAALDLMNGIIMVGGQFIIGKLIDRGLTPKMLAHYTGTVKNKDTGEETLKSTKRGLASDHLETLAKKSLQENAEKLKSMGIDISKIKTEDICKNVVKRVGKGSAYYDGFGKGFGLLITAIATTALTKRTIAPLLSTPLAGWFKGKFMDKKPKTDKDKANDKEFLNAANAAASRYSSATEPKALKSVALSTKA